MSKKRTPAGRPDPGHGTHLSFRSKAAWIAVICWWAAVLLAVGGLALLNSWLADESRVGAGRAGIWLIGFAAAAALTGTIGSIGSVLRDSGRIRIGAIFLLALPVVGIVVALIAVSSTVLNPTDPLMVIWAIVSALLLFFGTLLIVIPEHLGIF
ncbi:hypothetical protein [Propionimicrobium sp. PCR01-08-3]|uniref:hypothetical protein n=1 Tax=Propionimicrobium sp. PCR01-08-3 TaxID=3052086 RepID=UPI00255CB4CF|nr:hypothetical protein [Propionimicrobium sp. PCR01-08-3]WIY83148.1 hypothetical protein QQ658_01945 [Propionimicrobium sp. PCR01-08-3]